jgi:hypothetical protein
MVACAQVFMYAAAAWCAMSWKALEPLTWSDPAAQAGDAPPVAVGVLDGPPLDAGDPVRGWPAGDEFAALGVLDELGLVAR